MVHALEKHAHLELFRNGYYSVEQFQVKNISLTIIKSKIKK
jgi:hypothetical protein